MNFDLFLHVILETSLSLSLLQLVTYIDNLQDLRTRWDQQQMCELEFDSWLRAKETDVKEAIQRPPLRGSRSVKDLSDSSPRLDYTHLARAMSTTHLETLRSELLSKEPVLGELCVQHAFIGGLPAAEFALMPELEQLKMRLKALISRIDDALLTRRDLAEKALEVTQLSDHLHDDLTQVVRRSESSCSLHKEIKVSIHVVLSVYVL